MGFQLTTILQELPSSCFARDNTGSPSVVLGKCSENITSKGKQHKILGKLDIEGAEYTVIPHLRAKNVLCYFDAIMIEFHNTGFADQKTIDKTKHFYNFWYKEVKQCPLDEETYGKGEDKVPFPFPLAEFETSPYKVHPHHQ
jgi:hypothetical protein